MYYIAKATEGDLAFLVSVDWEDEGCPNEEEKDKYKARVATHRDKIRAFITQEDKCALVLRKDEERIGTIMATFRNRWTDTFPASSILGALDADLFPDDGRFCEIFQLWIHPEHRRQGHASGLKRALESECLPRGICMIYTHTAEENHHVVKLNTKLGYREVRRGPIWDSIVRISLIKDL